MNTNIGQQNIKAYRAVQNEGKISWRVEELWDGGVKRGPYGSKEDAIRSEEKIARDNGFFDKLVLQGIVGETKSHPGSFKKNTDGNWECTLGCSIEMENKEIVFNKGMTFTKGTPYMGVDVAKWLEEHL